MASHSQGTKVCMAHRHNTTQYYGLLPKSKHEYEKFFQRKPGFTFLCSIITRRRSPNRSPNTRGEILRNFGSRE